MDLNRSDNQFWQKESTENTEQFWDSHYSYHALKWTTVMSFLMADHAKQLLPPNDAKLLYHSVETPSVCCAV